MLLLIVAMMTSQKKMKNREQNMILMVEKMNLNEKFVVLIACLFDVF